MGEGTEGGREGTVPGPGLAPGEKKPSPQPPPRSALMLPWGHPFPPITLQAHGELQPLSLVFPLVSVPPRGGTHTGSPKVTICASSGLRHQTFLQRPVSEVPGSQLGQGAPPPPPPRLSSQPGLYRGPTAQPEVGSSVASWRDSGGCPESGPGRPGVLPALLRPQPSFLRHRARGLWGQNHRPGPHGCPPSPRLPKRRLSLPLPFVRFVLFYGRTRWAMGTSVQCVTFCPLCLS